MDIHTLIEQNRTNHYKLLVIVDNNKQHSKLIEKLEKDGWSAYDVTENLLRLLENIPKEKVKLRIGDEIKKWIKSLPDKIILYNTNILYSPELGKLSPIGAFKYKARDKEIIVILEGHASGNRIQYSTHGRDDYADMDVNELIHARMEDINV